MYQSHPYQNTQQQFTPTQSYGPVRPQQKSIEQSIMLSFQNENNHRRKHNMSPYPNVPTSTYRNTK